MSRQQHFSISLFCLAQGHKPPSHLSKYSTYATACKLVDPMSTHDGQLVVSLCTYLSVFISFYDINIRTLKGY
jgi:hypothetical protein